MRRKHLGQNFLYDPFLLRKIVDAAALEANDTVVEIGPGPGSMTRILAERAKRLIAIELDMELYQKLQQEFGQRDNVTLAHADALSFDYAGVGPFKVVSNIPYYITTPLIFRLLDYRRALRSMTITIQKEVAERIVASPGGKDYGVLSIAVQYHCDAELKFIVRKESFRPVPRVDSAVIHLVVRQDPAVAVDDETLFFRIVKAAFAQRRKMTANALKGTVPHAKEVLEALGINPMRRPETLSLGEFADIANAVNKKKGDA